MSRHQRSDHRIASVLTCPSRILKLEGDGRGSAKSTPPGGNATHTGRCQPGSTAWKLGCSWIASLHELPRLTLHFV
ncbi:Little elongation complex subunit [Trichinella pseudospiralis]